MDSIASLHNGQWEGMLIPLADETSLISILLCKHCHKEHLTLGKVFAFQTQVPAKGRSRGQSFAKQASLYASLRSNLPLGEKAQAILSTLAAVIGIGEEAQAILSTLVTIIGIGVALNFWLK